MKTYQNAFQCARSGECPESNGEKGCPAWIEMVLTNNQTGEMKITKGCNFQMMPFLITEAIKAADTGTKTSADIKNEVARGYSLIAQAIPGFVMMLAASAEKDTE